MRCIILLLGMKEFLSCGPSEQMAAKCKERKAKFKGPSTLEKKRPSILFFNLNKYIYI